MKRKIKAKMDDLIMAFDMNETDCSQYLNPETGGIATINEFGDSFDENGNPIEDTEKFLDNDRYIAIPGSDSREAYRDMERFIAEKVTDKSLKEELGSTLEMRRPFRRFKDVLTRFPRLQAQWYQYQDERSRQRIQEWLEENDLELED